MDRFKNDNDYKSLGIFSFVSITGVLSFFLIFSFLCCQLTLINPSS